MEIILTQEIYKLGHPGDVVKVADGYARNYLLPQSFAILATPANLKKVEGIRAEAEEKRQALLNEMKALAAKIGGVQLSFTRKADENGHLYGSVSEVDIVAALAEKDIEVQKTAVVMEKHLKAIGKAEIVIHLTRDVDATLTVKVFDEEGNLEVKVEEPKEVEVTREATIETTQPEVTVEVEAEVEEPAVATETDEEVSS